MSTKPTKHIAISPDFCENLFEYLEQNIVWLDELGQLLELEHKLLRERNFQSLSTIHAKKSQLIKALYRSKQQRDQLLHQAGLNDPKPLSFIQAVIPSTQGHRLAQLRQRITALTQQNTLINGEIAKQLHRNQASIRAVIDNLQGKQTLSTVYSANGKTSALRSDSYLAQA